MEYKSLEDIQRAKEKLFKDERDFIKKDRARVLSEVRAQIRKYGFTYQMVEKSLKPSPKLKIEKIPIQSKKKETMTTSSKTSKGKSPKKGTSKAGQSKRKKDPLEANSDAFASMDFTKEGVENFT